MLRRFLVQASLFLLILPGQQIYAVELMNNGDFESPQLAPWSDISTGSGRVDQLNKGTCMVDTDTRAIQIHGEKAAVLHAYSEKPSKSNSILRSNIFTAGYGVAFIALAAGIKNSPATSKLKLQVDLVDANSGNTIVSQIFSPSGIRLKPGCSGQALPEHTEAQPFSSHYFSTKAYVGRSIRLQFKLTPGEHAPGAFILLDQVVIFKAGEQAVFHSKPYAQAGVQRSTKGRLYLSARGSLDPDQYPAPLSYSWYLDNKTYHAPNPCLTSLDQGNYRVVLYVNDGHYAISDFTHFYVNKKSIAVDTIQDRECVIIKPSKAKSTQHIEAINTALLSWAKAWSERDARRYISFYQQGYAPAGKQHTDWATERQLNFRRKKHINISLSNIHIEQDKERYRASFTQRYESNSYRDKVNKELIFALQNDQWKIVNESIR